MTAKIEFNQYHIARMVIMALKIEAADDIDSGAVNMAIAKVQDEVAHSLVTPIRLLPKAQPRSRRIQRASPFSHSPDDFLVCMHPPSPLMQTCVQTDR